ncbi:MAG: amidase [Gloeobacteraceae cyanobacterium ES-bin-144]|nr:amidase [Verrucomicrobiales bacterium]
MNPRTRQFIYPALSGFILIGLISSCAYTPQSRRSSRDHAFIRYWAPPENHSGLRLAVKDLIDMKGYVTTAGSEYLSKKNPPAKRDAACLAIARKRNVQIVGKTNLTEFAITVSGKNPYFGTPVNRWDGKHKAIPGGSSSGSAVAVSEGWADVAFGTDTGGSIRVPAACCGIYGLKTTYGLVSTKGVFPISPKHLDTVGPMAADIPHLVEGMDLLQPDFASRYRAAVAENPSARSIRIGRLYISGTDPAIDKAIDEALAAKGFVVVKLDNRFKAKWAQAESDGKTIALGDAWLNDEKYTRNTEIGNTTRLVIAKGGLDYATGYKAAVKRKAAWQRELREVFQKVDFIATPTLQNLPPSFPWFGSAIVFEWLVFNSQNTVGVNFSGNPALAIPILMPSKGKTVAHTSLQLVGPRLSEAELCNAGRLLAAKP